MTMAAALVDQVGRDRITTDHATTLFVEAGAGSGKTSSLVSRLVSLVASGVDVTAIAAITFTEAAASELRTRVRLALERLEAGRDIRGIPATPDSASLARTALDRLDRATICTLHSFAQRILLSAPVQAGVPPALEVHDGISSALRFDDRWRRFERRLLDDDGLEPVLRTAFALGIGPRDFQAIAHTLTQNWDLVEEFVMAGGLGPMQAVDVGPSLVPVDDLIRRWNEVCSLAAAVQDPTDKLACWVADVADPIRSRLDANRDDLYGVIEVLGDELPSPANKGRRENWPIGTKDELVAAAKAAIEAGASALADVTDAVLTRLGAEIAAYTMDEADARRRDGRLEFHDLLVLARRLLRTSEPVRRRLHHQYRHLLIDEFQDTDPIQVELAVRIAADPAHATDTPWHEVAVEEGRLFFVGDPKQSIYRFRRADIDLFSRTAQIHAGGVTSLSVNFRTVDQILHFCNAVFARLIRRHETTEAGQVRTAQPDYVPLDVARGPIAGDPGPPVLVVGADGPHERAEPARTAEAADIAAALARAKREAWLVEDRATGRARPCEWSDMAVLLPSRSSLVQLRFALDDAAVPYRLETGTLIFGTTEIVDLLSILRAVHDPGDTIAIVGALRSAAYGCGDDDLYTWTTTNGPVTYLGAADQLDGDGSSAPDIGPADPVRFALADLRDRHRLAPFQSVPEIIDSILRDRQLMAMSLAGGRHRDAWRLYRVVLEEARHFADTEGGGLGEFLAWADLQRDDKVAGSSPTLPEADVDAVRVLTIHASKGLEFGITAVSGLSAQDPNTGTGATVLFPPDGGFAVKMRSGMETTRFDAARTLEETMDIHERIRLLYVALTRARDHLIVSTHHTKRARDHSHAGRLVSILEAIEEESGESLAPRWTAAMADGVASDADEAARVDDCGPPMFVAPDEVDRHRWQRDEAAWLDRRNATINRGLTDVVTATGLAARASGANEADVDQISSERLPEREPWRRGRAGTSIGSAVHAVLQHVDLADPAGAGVGNLARWHAMAEGVPDAAAEIEAKARAAITSDLVRRAVATGRWHREVQVGVALAAIDPSIDGDHLFEGFVDLLFEDADGLVVVDYKTDAVSSDADIAAALDRYRLQGAAYAVALEAAMGRSVTAVHFLFLRGSHGGGSVAHDAPLADLEQAKLDVRRVLKTPL